jgi:peptidoglycan/xylan/chitin deacetylase (PgdA/CDA1 family)
VAGLKIMAHKLFNTLFRGVGVPFALIYGLFLTGNHIIPAHADAINTYCPLPGETFDTISANAGVSVEALKAYNGLARLQAGDVLNLPPGSIAPDQWTSQRPGFSLDTLSAGLSGVFLAPDNRHKRVALTLDIGYNPRNIELMHMLHDRGIHATFFVLGLSVTNHPEIVTDILTDGHELGALSWEHDDLTQMTPDQVRSEFIRTEAAIHRADPGATSRPYFRAPFGSINPTLRQIAAEQGYYLIGWTTDNQDWRPGATADSIYAAVINHICPGAIIVMHGYRSNNADALPHILDTLAARGYQVVSLSELLHG